MHIWFHGTDRSNSEAIRKDGFKGGTYFAEHLEDALEFGGDHVFEVALDFKPLLDGSWQMRVSEPVPSTAIVSLTYYQCAKLLEYADRRAAVFDANAPGTASALTPAAKE